MGRTDDEEALALLQGEYPCAAIASNCWEWSLDAPAELAERLQAYADSLIANIEDCAEELIIERLDEIEEEEAGALG